MQCLLFARPRGRRRIRPGPASRRCGTGRAPRVDPSRSVRSRRSCSRRDGPRLPRTPGRVRPAPWPSTPRRVPAAASAVKGGERASLALRGLPRAPGTCCSALGGGGGATPTSRPAQSPTSPSPQRAGRLGPSGFSGITSDAPVWSEIMHGSVRRRPRPVRAPRPGSAEPGAPWFRSSAGPAWRRPGRVRRSTRPVRVRHWVVARAARWSARSACSTCPGLGAAPRGPRRPAAARGSASIPCEGVAWRRRVEAASFRVPRSTGGPGPARGESPRTAIASCRSLPRVRASVLPSFHQE